MALVLLLVLIDQATKLAVKGFTIFGIQHQGMQLGESRALLGETVRLTFVENPGMAFGISWGDGKAVLTLLTLAIVIGLTIYLIRLATAHWAPKLALTLVLAGAIGNLIDRVFYGVVFSEEAWLRGRVVDFIQVDIPDVQWFGELYTHWPVFNVADSCVSIGIVLLIFTGTMLPKEHQDNIAIDAKETSEERANP